MNIVEPIRRKKDLQRIEKILKNIVLSFHISGGDMHIQIQLRL